jgi:4-amino-4-deoxy-L-arabinose transferase-like glycosyltransferase
VRWALCVGLILLFFAQLLLGSRQLSLTADEPPRIVRGYTYLSSDDFWLVPIFKHPPLFEAWAALPLWLRPDPPDPVGMPYWREHGALYIQTMWPRLGSVAQLELAARVPVMLAATVLLALVIRWASEWAGFWGGTIAALLMIWDPAMIAHSQLATTDLGITLFVFASVYAFHRLASRPAWHGVLVTGVLTGLTLATKHSGVLILPTLGILALTAWARRALAGSGTSHSHLRQLAGWLGRLAAMFAIGFAVLWAVYRFEIERQSGFPWLVPMPSHVRSVLALFVDRPRLAFLRGQLSDRGWWWYFPYAFAIKTPLPLIAAVGFGLYRGACRGWKGWLTDTPLWLFPLLYGLMALRTSIQIGYRHLLPMLPFLYVMAARAIAQVPVSWRRTGRWAALALAAWYVVGTWSAYPYTLAYFNELVGGPSNGYRHLVDSNVDWGQSFKALADYIERERIARVRLSYWTWVDPAEYGLHYWPLPPVPGTDEEQFAAFAPPPGAYALSATTLQGLFVRNTELYDWFRHRQPVAQPGYGVLVYQVEPAAVPFTWAAQCTSPIVPLPADEIARGFGDQVRRVAYFDCTQAWLYPEGGRSGGWFVLHEEAPGPEDWFSARLLEMHLSYARPKSAELPAFSIYEWSPGSVRGLQSTASVPPDPAAPTGGLSVAMPVAFDGPLALLGYRVTQQDERMIELETWWEVQHTPDRPCSLIGHLVAADGSAVVVADGLGIPVTELHAGDQIVQLHRFRLSEGLVVSGGPYWLQTGGYWLDTMARWPVLTEDGPIGDRVVLTEVTLSE